MKNVILGFALTLIANFLYAQDDLNTVVKHLEYMRHMSAAQREAGANNSEFEDRLHDDVITPLLKGDPAQYVDALIAGMSDPDPYVRSHAADWVAAIAVNPKTFLIQENGRPTVLVKLTPSLLALTDEREEELVRVTALRSLARILQTNDSGIQIAFKKAIHDINARIRRMGLIGLARMPEEQSTVLNESLSFLASDSDIENRKTAVEILGESHLDDPRIKPALLQEVNDPHIEVQHSVIAALLRRFENDREVIRLLKQKLGQPNLDLDIRGLIERELPQRTDKDNNHVLNNEKERNSDNRDKTQH